MDPRVGILQCGECALFRCKVVLDVATVRCPQHRCPTADNELRLLMVIEERFRESRFYAKRSTVSIPLKPYCRRVKTEARIAALSIKGIFP